MNKKLHRRSWIGISSGIILTLNLVRPNIVWSDQQPAYKQKSTVQATGLKGAMQKAKLRLSNAKNRITNNAQYTADRQAAHDSKHNPGRVNDADLQDFAQGDPSKSYRMVKDSVRKGKVSSKTSDGEDLDLLTDKKPKNRQKNSDNRDFFQGKSAGKSNSTTYDGEGLLSKTNRVPAKNSNGKDLDLLSDQKPTDNLSSKPNSQFLQGQRGQASV